MRVVLKAAARPSFAKLLKNQHQINQLLNAYGGEGVAVVVGRESVRLGPKAPGFKLSREIPFVSPLSCGVLGSTRCI